MQSYSGSEAALTHCIICCQYRKKYSESKGYLQAKPEKRRDRVAVSSRFQAAKRQVMISSSSPSFNRKELECFEEIRKVTGLKVMGKSGLPILHFINLWN